MTTPSSFDPVVFHADLRSQFDAFLDEHRAMLRSALDDISEAEARQRVVGSKTTLLGLVKHATFVERVWFGEAIDMRPRRELGIADTPDGSFDLLDEDTVASVIAAYDTACAASRRSAEAIGLDDVVTGNRRGPLPLRWVYLHLLRELAQHCGHADIVREIVVGER